MRAVVGDTDCIKDDFFATLARISVTTLLREYRAVWIMSTISLLSSREWKERFNVSPGQMNVT